MLLTNARILNAKPRLKLFRMNDGEGLFLAVFPSGSKRWQFRYIFAERGKTLSIGAYPDISLCEAREAKHRARKLLRENVDPSSRKKQEKIVAAYKANNTLEEVALEWHTHRLPRWSEKHAAKVLRRLEIHVFPFIGSIPIANITALEILSVIERLEKAGKTHMSHRVFQLLCAIFNRAVNTLRVKYNPATSLAAELLPHETRHYPTISEDEVPKFLRSLEEVWCFEEHTKLAFWLLLLTGVRQCELRFSKKSDISFERGEWTLRKEITKMKRDRVVFLSDQTIVVLKMLTEQTSNSDWLVPSSYSWAQPVMSVSVFPKMIERMGYKGEIVGHGTRSLFSTILNDHGFNDKIVDRQLGHVNKDQVEAAYNRAEYEGASREVMQWWGDFLDSKRPTGERFCPKGSQIQGSFAQTMNCSPSYRYELDKGQMKPKDDHLAFYVANGGNQLMFPPEIVN